MAQVQFDILANISGAVNGIKKLGEEANKQQKLIAGFTGVLAFAEIGKLAASAAGAISGVFNSAIKEAVAAEEALNALEGALLASGVGGAEAAQELSAYASELENVSKFGDDAIISGQALLATLAPLTKDGIKAGSKAAIDLAQALKIDLDSAVRLVAKAAIGNVSALTKYGFEIRKGKDDTETFANALKVLEPLSGRAAEGAKSFGGAIAQLGNANGNLLEALGKIITENPVVIAAIQSITSIVRDLIVAVDEARPSITAFIVSFIEGLKEFKGVITGVVVALGVFGSALVVFKTATIAAIAFRAALTGYGAITTILPFLITNFGLLSARIGVATIAANGFALVLKATGIGLVIALVANLITKVNELNEATGSIIISFKALGLGIKAAFFEVTSTLVLFFSKVAGSFLSVFSPVLGLISSLTGAGDKIKKSISGFSDKLALQAIQANQAITDLSQGIILAGGAAKSASKPLGELVDQSRVQATEQLTSAIENLKKELNKVGDSGATSAQKEFDERLKLIKQGVKQRVLSNKDANDLILRAQKDFGIKLKEFDKKQLDERNKSIKEFITKAQSDLTTLFDIKKMNFDFKQSAAVIAGSVASAIGKGAEGARQAVVSVLTKVATTLLGPVGEALGPLFELLTQSPEKIREQINAFADELPRILEQLPEAIFTVLDVLAERLPELFARSANAFAAKMPLAAVTFAIELVKNIPQMVAGFASEFLKLPGRMIEELANGIKGIFASLGNPFGAVAGGAVGGVGGSIIGGIGDIFGFASGGQITGGVPGKDSVPGMLMPGELVVDRSLTEQLADFLAGERGASQPLTINLQVGEADLASVLLNINRNGFRTA